MKEFNHHWSPSLIEVYLCFVIIKEYKKRLRVGETCVFGCRYLSAFWLGSCSHFIYSTFRVV